MELKQFSVKRKNTKKEYFVRKINQKLLASYTEAQNKLIL
jgi:hypothetical protein